MVVFFLPLTPVPMLFMSWIGLHYFLILSTPFQVKVRLEISIFARKVKKKNLKRAFIVCCRGVFIDATT